jgi:hypothetical protein
MTNSTVRVFVNGKGYDVPIATSALDAVRFADTVEGDAIAAGSRVITDSRGIAVPADTPVYAGVIYRIVTNRLRDAEESA